MKVKAKLEKYLRLSARSIPCDVATRKSLKNGNVVDIDNETAGKLISMGIAEESKNKTKVKEKNNG